MEQLPGVCPQELVKQCLSVGKHSGVMSANRTPATGALSQGCGSCARRARPVASVRALT